MNEEIENKSRSGANSISNEVVARETQIVDIVKEETSANNMVEEVREETTNNGGLKPQNIRFTEQNINITVDKKGKNKKEKKNRNTRSFLLLLIVILVIVITIGLVYIKIKDLKEKYTIPKKVESVFDEITERKDDDDLKYVSNFGDTFDYNDIEIKIVSMIDGVEIDDISKVDFNNVKNQKHYIVISGLKDKIVQNKVNETIKNKIDEVACADSKGKIYASCSCVGSFSNVLSLEVTYPRTNEENSYITEGLNFDLTTGELIPFDKVFTSSAPIKSILYNACMESLAWNVDVGKYYQGIEPNADFQNRDLSNVDDYGTEVASLYDSMKDKIEYSISPTGLRIYNFSPSFIGNKNLQIKFGDYSNSIAIYKRYLTSSSIYENNIRIKDAFTFVGAGRGNSTGTKLSKSISEMNTNYISNISLYSYGYSYQTKQIDLAQWKNMMERDIISNYTNKASANSNNKYYITGMINITTVEPSNDKTYEYQIKQKYAQLKGAKYLVNIRITATELVNTSSELFARILYAESKIPRAAVTENPIKELEDERNKQFIEEINMPTINYDTSYNGNFYYDSNYKMLFDDTAFPSMDEMVKYIDDYEMSNNNYYGS